MPYYQKDRKDAAGAGGAPLGDKPWENPPSGGGSAAGGPPGPAPEGYEWRFQSDPSNPQKGWWILAAAAVGAIGSYLSARSANKPRTGYTDQTTTQTPYMEGAIRPDIEAILNYQRELINRGPNYVGDQRYWPTSPSSPQPGRAPGPMERTDERWARVRQDLDRRRAEGGGFNNPEVERPSPGGGGAGMRSAGGGKAGMGGVMEDSGAPRPRTFGGYTAAELEANPMLADKLGERGSMKYDRYRRRNPLEEDDPSSLPRLRALFAMTRR